MKTPDKNKQKILVLLLVALALSFIYRITHPFKQEQVDALTFDKKNHFKRIYGNSSNDYRANTTGIMLNFIDIPPNHSGRVVKNIFTPGSSVGKTGDKTISEISKQDAITADEGNIKNNGIATSEQTGSELSNLKVFGIYENEQDKVVFLERGKDILALREGDIIDGTFKVQTISSKMVTIKSKYSDRPLLINMNGLENN